MDGFENRDTITVEPKTVILPPVPAPNNNRNQNKRMLPLIIAAAALVMLGIVTAVLFLTGVLGGRGDYWKTTVPSVVKQSCEKAEKRLEKQYLHALIKDRDDEAVADADVVVSQTPEAKKIVNKGSTVELILSSGKGKIFVPDVSNYEESYAQKVLEDEGFTVRKSYISDDSAAAPGSVIWMSEDPGTEKKKGDRLELKIRKGTEENTQRSATVPALTGTDYYEAQSTLKKNDLYLTVVDAQFSDTVPEGAIISQEPESSIVPRGTIVKVVRSLGTQKARVQDVVYCTLEHAKEILTAQGFAVRTTERQSRTVAEGTVMEQSIEAGTLLDAGETITLTVSSGYEADVPDVVGMQEKEAIDALWKAGLAVKVVFAYDAAKPEHEVLAQSAEAGTKLKLGAEIVITVNEKRENTEPAEKPAEKKILSPESAVKLYLKNEDVWSASRRYPGLSAVEKAGFSYTFIDLDFDGVLELAVNGSEDGRAKTAMNTFYRLDVDNRTVREMESNVIAEISDMFSSAEQERLLLKNTENNRHFYYSSVFTQGFIDEFYNENHTLYLKNQKVFGELLFGEHQIPGENSADEIRKEYYSFKEVPDAEWDAPFDVRENRTEVLSKEAFDSLKKQYLAQNADCHLTLDTIYADETDDLSDDEKYDVLVKLYRSFSYDGFSFDELDLYDLEEPQQPDASETAYAAYAKVYQELKNQHGALQTQTQNGMLTGLCFADLIDFDHDGTEELYLIHGDASKYGIESMYTFEIWGMDGGKAVKLFSGNPFGTDGGVGHAYIAKHEASRYVVTGWADSGGTSEYYGLKDGVFQKVIVFDISEDFSEESDWGYKFTINNKVVSQEEWDRQQEEWKTEYDLFLLDNPEYFTQIKEKIAAAEKALGI